MANYLYYMGGCDGLPSSTIGGTYEFSSFNISSQEVKKGNLIIATGTYNGNLTGDAFTPGVGGLNPGYRAVGNWTQYFDGAGMGAFPEFVIGCVDNDIVSNLESVPGGANGFFDRAGVVRDFTMHHGSLSNEVYTVLSPATVSKFGSGLDGTVAVWYIAATELGAGANAIGLPVIPQLQPISADSDAEAASKMLFSGLGVFRANDGKHEAFGWEV